jgi:hypothetical protein
MSSSSHSLYSSYRESLLEHVFAGEVMRVLWLDNVTRIEVLKPQVDDGGYDLVLEARGVVRHVQLKASHRSSSTRKVNVNLGLCEKPSGCVVWLNFDEATLELGPFWWLGNKPGQPLPSLADCKTARHTKGDSSGYKAERPRLKEVPRVRFQKVDSIKELTGLLFGK